ncbi:hypothetical protein L950_0212685 [Sphingobacterium sp. IITKGP-BTPF85]|nr:hypothetical protein L950_0212685 [Sphingobacterium sp. IITKGP-BTPF85]
MDETYAYVHELLNRQMALRAKLKIAPLQVIFNLSMDMIIIRKKRGAWDCA